MSTSNIFGKSSTTSLLPQQMMMNKSTVNNNNNMMMSSTMMMEDEKSKKAAVTLSKATTDVFIAVYSWIPSSSQGHEIVPLSFFKPFDAFALGGGISSFKFVSAWDAVMIARTDRPEVCVHAVPSGTYLGSLDGFTTVDAGEVFVFVDFF